MLMSALEDSIAQLRDDKDLMPRPDLAKYPRTDVHIPEDTDGGGWAIRVCNMLLCRESGNNGWLTTECRLPSRQFRQLAIYYSVRHLSSRTTSPWQV